MKIGFSIWFYIEMLIIFTIIYFIVKSKIFYASTKTKVKFVNEEEIREQIRKKKQVIDTREKDDMTFDYIKGVRNITNMDFMQKNFTLNYSNPIYIINWTEKQELKSANKFRKLGATEIYVLKGGMSGTKGATSGRFEKIDNIKLSPEEIEDANN